MHTDALLDITIVVAAALVCGLALRRLRQPPIVGYIVAGALFGPSALGLIESREAIGTLAELGVLLLLFIIGMELSLRAFRRVLRLAVLGGLAQILLSVGVMLLLGGAFGWPMPLAILLGFVVALSSTAVAFKILEEIGELRTDVGRVAVGVLIAQDLAVVPMLLLVDGMAGDAGLPKAAIGKTLLAVGLLALMIAYLTRRERVAMPFAEAIGDNVELTALVALTFCFLAALISALFGLSPASGAFLAGLWIGNSRSRARVLAATLPIQGVLLMVFFLSIGFLLDLGFIWENVGQVLTLLVVVTLCKTAMNVAITAPVGRALGTRLARRRGDRPDRRVLLRPAGGGCGRRHDRRRLSAPDRRGDRVELDDQPPLADDGEAAQCDPLERSRRRAADPGPGLCPRDPGRRPGLARRAGRRQRGDAGDASPRRTGGRDLPSAAQGRGGRRNARARCRVHPRPAPAAGTQG